VLRRSERRHNACEKADPPKSAQKDVDAQIEDMDWELCLRKFFDLFESRAWNQEPETTPSLSRQSSFNRSDYIQPIQRSNTNSSVRSSYGEFRRGEELNTSQFYRPPRRRNSTASHHSAHDADADASSALVLYGSNQAAPASRAVRRPVRRSSVSADFHWEYVGRSSTFEILAPLTARWPELKDAQVDIYTQTEGMSAAEARAYALGRLASLPPEMTDEVRRVLTEDTRNRGPPARYRPKPPARAAAAAATVEDAPPKRSMSLEDMRMPRGMSATAELSNAYIRARQHPPEGPRPVQQKPAKEDGKPAAKPKGRSFLNLSDLRPLTAISERPSTSKSRNSSIDRGSARSIMMHPFIHRRSNLSAQVLETVPDATPLRKPEGRSSSGSDTLTSDKDFPQRLPAAPSSARRAPPVPGKGKRAPPPTAQQQQQQPPRSPVDVEKPLPPKPRASRTRQSVLAFFRARSGLAGHRGDLRSTLQPSTVSLASHLSAGRSRESLGPRASMDLLKRKDSRVTLFSLAEGMDVPFDMWLNALPYIEGRCQTPKNM
jgi:hypothetical protein